MAPPAPERFFNCDVLERTLRRVGEPAHDRVRASARVVGDDAGYAHLGEVRRRCRRLSLRRAHKDDGDHRCKYQKFL